jgi:hypothetical protein
MEGRGMSEDKGQKKGAGLSFFFAQGDVIEGREEMRKGR